MSELIRKPYKITLWEDRNIYIARQPQKGDVNFDGVINNKDYTRLLSYVSYGNVEIDEWAADIDNNNIIDNNDLSLFDSSAERQELIDNPILKPSERKSILSEHDLVQNQYLEEVCIATIGSDTMDTPIRAFNPILTEELNGSKTFTFQINYRYWDDDDEEFKLNPFINLLVNERKVKLKYDNNWYDFVIKQTDENSDSNTFTYTCKDLFINELGKTGYEVELDTELRNNMGTITELATSILKGTDWQVDEDNCDSLIQRNKEGLYSFVIPKDSQNQSININCTPVLGGDPISISSGQVILVFYSCKANKENPIQFLYKEQGDYSTADEAIANFYKTDEYGFVIDADNYELTCSELGISDLDDFYDSLTSSSYFGQKIIKKQEMHYLPQIDETCLVYTHYDKESAESGNPQENQWYELDDEVYVLTEDTEVDSEKEYYSNNRYYCYKELEYASVAQVQNMLSNSSGFISTNGWIGQVYLSTVTSDEVVQRAIHLDGSTYNTGFYDNRQLLSPKGFVNGEKYIVAVKGTGTLGTSTLKLADKTNPNSETTVLTFSQTTGFTTPDELDGYTVKMATCGSTISYSTIINNYGDIRFYLGYSGDLIDCKVFKYRTDSAGKMIVPDLEQLYYKVINPNGENPKNEGWYELSSGDYILTNDTSIINGKNYYKKESPIIQTRYNFFLESSIPNNIIYTKQDLIITESLLDTTTGYELVMIDGCQKVTSITGSKSNRFNLIQSLCEAFECWAKFTIEHDENGKIIYKYIVLPESEYVKGGRYYQRISGSGESSNDSFFKIYKGTSFTSGLYKKVYSKYVTFKEYIGDDNPVGFKYGINLSSIQRNIISDQIASKVIVQANSNEFAPNGSCTIQQSVLNPTGENALYNFQYFINHGLLDVTSLYDDLYGTNGGLGFYTKMKQYNDSIQPKIQELSEISKSLYTLNSRQTVYDALIEEANRLYEDASLELNSAGYGSNGGTVPTYITELRNEMSSYQSTISYYSNLSSRNKTLLDAYTAKYNQISEDLASVRALKDKLNQDFANKYYRFIQEGTWNSEDYWDPELYYQAANMVLYTSSFPQISYSINVLEISEIEGFEAYKFKIADKTYIEDTEFFGYDSKGRPYKEEIIVSQVTRYLDDNSQNTITVQNYKTQFQDLFQRIAATSQSLQYHEGAYQRAASAINNDGTINSALLQNSLEANALVIQNANNQSVVWDETGITISNFVNANELVRLTSKGIVLSSNGGKDWTTGITGDGINADVITAGRIDTDRIRIFNKAMQQTFEWNSTGINAYMWDSSINGGLVDENNDPILGAVNYGKFVRFDQYGLYGYAGGNPSWDPHVEDNSTVGINKVIRDSIFSLTWKGLNIKTGAQGGFTQIANPSGNPSAQMWYELSSGQYILTDDTEVENEKTYYKSDNEVINVNDKFKVDGQGNITLAGSITLAGNITWSSTNMPQTDVTSQNVYDAIVSGTGTGGKFNGIFNTTNGLHIDASSINTGTLNASNVTITNLNANSITAGTLKVSQIYDSDNNRITGSSSSNIIKGEYLTLKGIEIKNGNTTTFKIDSSGNVTLKGTLNGADGTFNGTLNAVDGIFTGSFQGSSFDILEGQNGKYFGSIKVQNDGLEINSIAAFRIRGQYNSGSNPPYISSEGNVAIYAGAASSSSFGSQYTSLILYSNYNSGGRSAVLNCALTQGSDRKLKNSINYDIDKYGNLIKKVKPVIFKYNGTDKFHFGFIAQDIKQILEEDNYDINDFGLIRYNINEEDSYYSLSYNDFIALQQWQIQKLEARVSTLENLISSQNSDIL